MNRQTEPHERLQPPRWKPAKGYANAVVARGRTVYLAGQIGWNGDQVFESDDFVAQVRQALANIVEILAEAGGGPQDVVRMTWFITDKPAYVSRLSEIGAAYRSVMGRSFPAMSVVVVTALVEDRAKVEIEATAVLPG